MGEDAQAPVGALSNKSLNGKSMSLDEIFYRAKSSWGQLMHSKSLQLRHSMQSIETELAEQMKWARRRIVDPERTEQDISTILKTGLKNSQVKMGLEITRLENSAEASVHQFQDKLAHRLATYALSAKTDFLGYPLLSQVEAIARIMRAKVGTKAPAGYQVALLYEGLNNISPAERALFARILQTFFSEHVRLPIALLTEPDFTWSAVNDFANLFVCPLALSVKRIEILHNLSKLHLEKDETRRKSFLNSYSASLRALRMNTPTPSINIEYSNGEWNEIQYFSEEIH